MGNELTTKGPPSFGRYLAKHLLWLFAYVAGFMFILWDLGLPMGLSSFCVASWIATTELRLDLSALQHQLDDERADAIIGILDDMLDRDISKYPPALVQAARERLCRSCGGDPAVVFCAACGRGDAHGVHDEVEGVTDEP